MFSVRNIYHFTFLEIYRSLSRGAPPLLRGKVGGDPSSFSYRHLIPIPSRGVNKNPPPSHILIFCEGKSEENYPLKFSLSHTDTSNQSFKWVSTKPPVLSYFHPSHHLEPGGCLAYPGGKKKERKKIKIIFPFSQEKQLDLPKFR